MDPGRICEAATSCQKLFSSSVSNVTAEEHFAYIRSAQGDFNLWCAAIKATSVGKASLDHRLSDHSDMSDIVCKWLASLKASLETYELRASELGNGDNEATASDSSSGTGKPASWDAISYEWSDSDSFLHHEAPVGADLVATECISYIRTALDRLAWLSLTIRKAGSRYRYERADKELELNDQNLAEYRVHLTRIILRGTRNPGAVPVDTNKIMERMSNYSRLTAVQKQLIRANMLRKNRIEYVTRERGEKLSTVETAKPRADSHGEDDSSVIRSSSIAGSTKSSPSRPIEKRRMGSNIPPVAATTAQTASGIESKFDFSPILSGRAPSVASNLSRGGVSQAYPRCPRPDQGCQIKCPYCLDVLPTSCSKSEKAWRAHVSQDILPYTCFIEGCSTPDEMYLTSETLLAHLVEEHSSLRWICDFCALGDKASVRREFCSAEGWKQHMKEAHKDRTQTLQRPQLAESQLAELAELNKRPMIGPLSCPLCDFATPNMSYKVDDHILQHLHEFSLRALPDPPKSGQADGSRASGVAVMLSHVTDIKSTASGNGYSPVLPDPNPSNIIDGLIHMLPPSIEPRLQNFLDWVKNGSWASTTASREFWTTQFGKLQHVINIYDEGMEANIDIAPAVLEDLVGGTLDDLLTGQLERNPSWLSSSYSDQGTMSLPIGFEVESHILATADTSFTRIVGQPTWRINLPPLNAYFIARDEVLDALIDDFLDEIEPKLLIGRPRFRLSTVGDAQPKRVDKLAEDDHPGLSSRRRSTRDNVQPRVILTGDKNAGKTAIAVELAHRIAGEHPACSMFWVDATSVTSIQDSYQHIWESMGKPQGPLDGSAHALVYRLNWEIPGPWLMVLDGISAHTLQHMVFRHWIPSSLNGTLLLTTQDTSRLSSIIGSAESVEVPPLPPFPAAGLWDKLMKAKASSKYPYKADFWPEGSLQRIITKNDIITELYAANAVDNELVEFILRYAMKVLATCLMSQIRHSSLAQTMHIFRTHNFCDRNLPVDENVFKGYEFANTLPWDPPQTLSFSQYQWKFIALTFPRATYLPENPLPEETILPFIDNEALDPGNLGTVHKVTVHPSHFDRDDPVHQTNYQVAIKEVTLTGNDYESLETMPNLNTLATREKRALLHVLLLKKESPERLKHTIDVKAIFDHGRRRYYMFPWADGGHLWNLWERPRDIQPQGEGKFVANIVAQILGLAGALAVLHQENCRHGDLKPENILIFRSQNQTDTWKIADFGLAKFHHDQTRERWSPTTTRHGTVSYEPPEFLQDDQPTSRLYDMWSMGCIILQLVIWLLYDIHGVQKLATRTRNMRQNESTFWTKQWTGEGWGEVIVHKEVDSHIETIMRDPHVSEAIKDLLRVVRDQLLVIQLPSDSNTEWRSGYRANAETLCRELERIVKRGNSDDGYWFTRETSSGTGSLGQEL